MTTSQSPNLALGTAGHIDHGKSALVYNLTGVDPDTLAEEKERGITIELGFAELQLPDGRAMTVVDVPGHERFVKQMIVGAAGIDVALLVIAADDGVMPQTYEHAAVLQVLGIQSCVVALTKIDLVEESWLDLVEEDIRSFLATTPYADARIVRCSNVTREGIEDVRQAIADACDETPVPHRSLGFRQPAHRVFSVKGAGTVVTGVVWSGVARVGDPVEVLPSGKRGRIRGIQMYGRAVDEAPAGNCVAVNISEVKTGDIEAGDFIATPGFVKTSDRFDCYFTYIDTAETGKPLETGVKMHVAHGAKEVLGRVLFADGLYQLYSGQSCYAQIRLDEPLPVSCYDRFIVRSYSPVRVAGGGQVLLTRPRRRTNLGEEREVLEMLHEGDFQHAVERELGFQLFPCTCEELAALFGTDGDSMRAVLSRGQESGNVVALGEGDKYFYTPSQRDRLLSEIEEALLAFHKEQPTERGMKKEALRQRCFPHMETDRFNCLIELAVARGMATVHKGDVGHASVSEDTAKAEVDAIEAIGAFLQKCGSTPPDIKGVSEQLSLPLPLVRRAMAVLVEQGRVYRVTPDLYYDQSCIDGFKQKVAALCDTADGGSLGDIRDALGIGRKATVEVLDAFDAEEFTVRDGDRRFLKKD